MRTNVILLAISIFILGSAFYLHKNEISEYKRKRNVEVVVIDKTQLQVPGGKNATGRVDSYLIVQALNEVKDEAVNLKDHTFVRNSTTMTENGSIKSKFITKTYQNGPKFDIKVDLTTYMLQPVGTRVIYNLSNREMYMDESKENKISMFLLLMSSGITLLIISLLRVALWR